MFFFHWVFKTRVKLKEEKHAYCICRCDLPVCRPSRYSDASFQLVCNLKALCHPLTDSWVCNSEIFQSERRKKQRNKLQCFILSVFTIISGTSALCLEPQLNRDCFLSRSLWLESAMTDRQEKLVFWRGEQKPGRLQQHLPPCLISFLCRVSESNKLLSGGNQFLTL